jgi:hypothetical protein
MSDKNDAPVPTKVYTTEAGLVAIEQSTSCQSTSSVVLLSAEQILTVIKELHVCYDYCAAWKEPTRE